MLKRNLLAATALVLGAAALPLAAGAAEPVATSRAAGMVNGETSMAQHAAVLFTDFQDAELVNAEDDTVAQVEDLLVDEDGQAHAVVVSEGGVLGVGQQYRLITLEAGLPPMSDGRILVDMKSKDVETLPAYEYPEANDEAGNRVTAPQGASPTTNVATLWPLSKLIGLQVREDRSEDADSVGEIEDVRLGADGSVQSFVLDRGGLFGLGADERDLAFDHTALSGTAAQPVVTALRRPVDGTVLN